MKRFISILFQIDEAAEYINDGRLEHMRLALLLLDNAAEMQMYLRVQQELKNEEWKKGFKEKVLEHPVEELDDSLKEYVEWQPFGLSKEWKIDRYFDEKIEYLCDDLSLLDTNVGDVLSYLHEYRNEAYHRAKVREETISTAAKLLLEINLEMLISISRHNQTYESDQDYSWINNKLGYNAASESLGEEAIKDFIDIIRKKISLLDSDVAKFLASHIESRINDLKGDLDFITEMLPHCKNHDDAIRFSNYIKLSETGDSKLEDVEFEEFKGDISAKEINEIQVSLNELKTETNKINSFKLFSNLETKLEKVEKLVIEIVADLDYMIQMEVDRRRGK